MPTPAQRAKTALVTVAVFPEKRTGDFFSWARSAQTKNADSRQYAPEKPVMTRECASENFFFGEGGFWEQTGQAIAGLFGESEDKGPRIFGQLSPTQPDTYSDALKTVMNDLQEYFAADAKALDPSKVGQTGTSNFLKLWCTQNTICKNATKLIGAIGNYIKGGQQATPVLKTRAMYDDLISSEQNSATKQYKAEQTAIKAAISLREEALKGVDIKRAERDYNIATIAINSLKEQLRSDGLTETNRSLLEAELKEQLQLQSTHERAMKNAQSLEEDRAALDNSSERYYDRLIALKKIAKEVHKPGQTNVTKVYTMLDSYASKYSLRSEQVKLESAAITQFQNNYVTMHAAGRGDGAHIPFAKVVGQYSEFSTRIARLTSSFARSVGQKPELFETWRKRGGAKLGSYVDFSIYKHIRDKRRTGQHCYIYTNPVLLEAGPVTAFRRCR